MIHIRHNKSPVILIDDVFRYLVQDIWNTLIDDITASVDNSQALLIASRFPTALKSMTHSFVLHKGQFVEGGPTEAVLHHPVHSITQSLLWHRLESNPFEVNESIETVSTVPTGEFATRSPGHWVLAES
jgi:ABC-type glutathione transport system ATPase component